MKGGAWQGEELDEEPRRAFGGEGRLVRRCLVKRCLVRRWEMEAERDIVYTMP